MSYDTSYWRQLDATRGCIHPADQPFVDAHNALLAADAEAPTNAHAHWIRTDRMAEPRLGRLDAPLIILQLNPSFDELPQDYVALHRDLLDPSSDHAGLRDPVNRWWGAKFKQLRAVYVGEFLQRNVCSIEFFPYASRSFNHAHLRLPSQQFQFELVRAALRRNAVLIVTRGLNLWCGAVPELRAALGKSVFRTRNPQNACITKGNVEGEGWSRINTALQQSGR